MKFARNIAIAIATTFALGAASVAIAGGPGRHGPPGIEGHILRVMHDLDLTDDQRAQLREIRESNRPDREAAHEEREAMRKAMRAELSRDVPDSAVIHQLLDDAADRARERAHDRMDTVLEIHTILTPAQRSKLGEALDEMPERGGREEGGRRRVRK